MREGGTWRRTKNGGCSVGRVVVECWVTRCSQKGAAQRGVSGIFVN